MRLRNLPILLALICAPLAASAQHQDIVEIAASNDDFATLVAAVQAAGLVETLQGDGPFTVFAPTNEAFARLGSETIQNLLRPENRPQLVAILTYHVVPGKVLAGDVASLNEATTVNGEKLSIGFRINDAELVATDVMASNGVIHVIDRVLMPRELPAPQTSQSSSHH